MVQNSTKLKWTREEVDQRLQQIMADIHRICMEAAEEFVHRYWRPIIDGQSAPPTDAKTELQEWAQGKGFPLPKYREIRRQGPSHAPTFVMEVSVQSALPVTAMGPSKRASEKAAAEAMLKQIRAKNDW